MVFRDLDKQALKQNAYTVLSKITLLNDNSVFTEDDFIVDWTYEDYRYVPDVGFIGQFVERILDGNLQNIPDDKIFENQEVNLQIGIVNGIDNITTWYDYGNFLITDVKKTDTTGNYSFQSADYTKKFNKVFDGNYTDTVYTKSFNQKIEDEETVTALWLAQYVCKQAGVVLYTTNFTNADFVISSNQYDSEDTLRKVMQDIGKLAYSWVRVAEDNKVHIDFTPKTTSSVDQYDQLTTDEYYVSKKSDLIFGPVNKVLIGMSSVEGENMYETSQDYTPETECAIKIYDNNLTNTEELRALALNGCERLFGIEYTPMEIETIGHPWLEGDELIKLTNVDDEVLYTYPFNRKLTYAGYIKGTIGVEATTAQDSEYEYKSDIISNVKKTTIIVDKQNQTITGLVEDVGENTSNITTLQESVGGISATVEALDNSVQDVTDQVNSVLQAEKTIKGNPVNIEDSGEYLIKNISFYGNLEQETEEEEAGTTIDIVGSTTLTDVDTTKESRVLSLKGQTSQNGTPTPSSPIPVNVVSGDNEINICGKNLFDKDTVKLNKRLDNSTPPLEFGDTNYFLTDYIRVKPNTSYTGNSVFTNIYNRIAFYDMNKNWLSSYNGGNVNTITTPSNCYYMRFGKQKEQLNTFMLVEGTTIPSTYEPYIGNIYPIYLGVNEWKSSNALQGPYNANAYLLNTRIAWYGKQVASGDTLTVKCNNSTLQFTLGRTTMNTNNSSNVESQDTGWKTGEFTLTYNGSGYAFVGISKTDNTNVLISSLTDDDFEISYNGQRLSSTPIELCKIGNYQDSIYKGVGYNLFDKDDVNSLDAYFSSSQTTIASNTTNKTIYIPCQPNTTYTMRKINSAQFYLGYTHEEPNTGVEVYGITNTATIFNTNYKYITFTTDANASYIVARVYQSAQDTQITFQEICNTIQITKGNQVLPYEPYNAKDKWLLHKEIGKVVLNGSENWSSMSQSGNYYRLYYNVSDAYDFGNSRTANLYCDMFRANTGNDYNIVWFTNKNAYFYAPNGVTTKQDFLDILTNRNANMYYVLATPTTTEITDTTLLEQLDDLESQ